MAHGTQPSVEYAEEGGGFYKLPRGNFPSLSVGMYFENKLSEDVLDHRETRRLSQRPTVGGLVLPALATGGAQEPPPQCSPLPPPSGYQ